jgi:hypothetical protein
MHGQQNIKLVVQNTVMTDNLWLKVRFLLSTRKPVFTKFRYFTPASRGSQYITNHIEKKTINITSKDISIYLKSDFLPWHFENASVYKTRKQEEMDSVKSALHSCII